MVHPLVCFFNLCGYMFVPFQNILNYNTNCLDNGTCFTEVLLMIIGALSFCIFLKSNNVYFVFPAFRFRWFSLHRDET